MFFLVIILTLVIATRAQECGVVSPDSNDLPWQAGIFNKLVDQPYLEWRCGGSLVSDKVVITAAHFLWEPMRRPEDSVVRPALITVAVGKLTRPWTEPVDDTLQKSEVKEIRLAPSFEQRGSGAIPYFADDIAVVVVTDAFRFNENIRPVCLNFDYDFEQKQLQRGNMGKASGWWRDGDRAPALQVKELFFVSVYACVEGNSTDSLYADSKLFTLAISDKICVNAMKPKSALCTGDSGIGLTFPAEVDGTVRYYLRGVMSAPLDYSKLCTIETYYGFTSLRKHESFIRKYWNESLENNQPQTGKCALPPAPYPEHGSYITNVTRVSNTTGREGYELVTLEVTCQPGYGVLGSNSISCFNGFWPDDFPKCIRMCLLKPHPSVEYRCLVSGEVVGSRACLAHEPPGTLVSPRCRRPHFYSASTLGFMRCGDDGYWDYIARCTPECGRVVPSGTGLVAGGTTVKRGEVPWHAGVYSKTTQPYIQICGGTLISNNIVISAAHCFWTDLQKQLPASLFAVAVGKLYRPWNDPTDEAQKSDVKEIHLPERFQGAGTNFQDDVAVVVVNNAFEYKTHVRPVCLSFDSNFDRLQLQTINKGKVAGWGLTAQNGKPSPTLQVIELPYVEVGTCIDNSPPDFLEYITSDKICAGTQLPNSALCKGDSGGGLAFPTSDRGTQRYYLRGVVSTAPNNENACNTATYTSFTQILKHEDFIKQFLNEL